MLQKEEKEYIEEILYYLQHHNKNLTKKQDFIIDDLEELILKSGILNN
jgi:hypothetical protein